jgi:probable phosphoglycerate mutase
MSEQDRKQATAGAGGTSGRPSGAGAGGNTGDDGLAPVLRQLRFVPPPGATEIVLVRHGESAPFSPGTLQPLLDGQGDPELAELGRRQAERVAERLATGRVDAIYRSPLRRTGETAAPLARRLGLEPVIVPDLAEVHLGEWEGGLFRQRMREGGPLAEAMLRTERWDVIPGAESNEDLTARIRAAVGRMSTAHPGGRVVAVAHAGLIGMTLSIASGARPLAFTHVDNASISLLVVTGDRWIVRSFNDTSHLEHLEDLEDLADLAPAPAPVTV